MMKQNRSVLINRTTFGVPKYSEKYKDVLERIAKESKNYNPLVQTKYQFYRIKAIGVGSFSFVYMVQNQETNTLYAQKAISKSQYLKHSTQISSEIKLHYNLNHQRIIKLYHFYCDDSYLYLIMELAENSLFSKKNQGYRFKEFQIVKIIKEILQGLAYIHQQGIIHGDIKLENIVQSNGHVKICDFGCSYRYNKPVSKDIVGTFQYLAPQYAQGYDSQYKRDIWAVGIILYQLLMGTNPFESVPQSQKFLMLIDFPNRINGLISALHWKFKEFLTKTLCNMSYRLSAEQLLRLDLFLPLNQIQQ